MKKFLTPFLSLFSPDQEKPRIQFNNEWVSLLKETFPLYNQLPEALISLLHEKVTQFINSKTFEGCNGFELSDEVIVLISAHACLLILNQEGTPYPNLKTVLVYPTTFKSVQRIVTPSGIVTEQEVSRLGESWSNGTVVLAWDSVKNGAQNTFDGHNVSIHEFVHQLDQSDGSADGLPQHGLRREEFQVWCTEMQKGYSHLLELTDKGRKSVIDKYGATNPAEFFAVASETFFEKPRQLRKKEPEIYQLLSDFYGLDPLEW